MLEQSATEGMVYPPVSKNNIDHAIAKSVLEQTQQQMSWAISVFEAWCEARDELTDLVQIGTVEVEEKLCHFIMKARRQNGETYPSKTVYGIVAGIQHYLHGNGRHEILFLNASDPTFACLRQTLDTQMKAELRVIGVPIIVIPFTLCSI